MTIEGTNNKKRKATSDLQNDSSSSDLQNPVTEIAKNNDSAAAADESTASSVVVDSSSVEKLEINEEQTQSSKNTKADKLEYENTNTPDENSKEEEKFYYPQKSGTQFDNIRHVIVTNDGDHKNLVRLVGLKNLFAKQLPKMPKDYIVRLVFDRRHKSLAILSNDPAVKGTDDEIIGGICYRAYPDMRFSEIAFCAVNQNQQVKVSVTIRSLHHTRRYIYFVKFKMWFLIVKCC